MGDRNQGAVTTSKIASEGWQLISAEDRNAEYPTSFQIPNRKDRESLIPGDGAKLLFDLETRVRGQIVDRGVDRMWVIVKTRIQGGYLGVLDNDPGIAENIRLREGDIIRFGPEHVSRISKPPREYVIKKYGECFFGT